MRIDLQCKRLTALYRKEMETLGRSAVAKAARIQVGVIPRKDVP